MFLSLLDLLRQQTGALPALAPEAEPAVEFADQGHTLLFRAQLRGIDPKSVQIQLKERSLGIGGMRTVEERTEGPDFWRMQAAVSQFYREVPLPCRINPHRAVARWEGDGTLLVTLPKT
ncbi:MAG TPA: Hsp20/alpha crystallin family protein [Symbiobacteriaceae bacterium]|nr:Hsp20/alpha crystallin family protein [Symbiobacteriaceae bacterium]